LTATIVTPVNTGDPPEKWIHGAPFTVTWYGDGRPLATRQVTVMPNTEPDVSYTWGPGAAAVTAVAHFHYYTDPFGIIGWGVDSAIGCW